MTLQGKGRTCVGKKGSQCARSRALKKCCVHQSLKVYSHTMCLQVPQHQTIIQSYVRYQANTDTQSGTVTNKTPKSLTQVSEPSLPDQVGHIASIDTCSILRNWAFRRCLRKSLGIIRKSWEALRLQFKSESVTQSLTGDSIVCYLSYPSFHLSIHLLFTSIQSMKGKSATCVSWAMVCPSLM